MELEKIFLLNSECPCTWLRWNIFLIHGWCFDFKLSFDSKTQKKTLDFQIFFRFLTNQSSPSMSQFHQRFTCAFFVRMSFLQLFYVHVTREKLPKVQTICAYNVDKIDHMMVLTVVCQSWHNFNLASHLVVSTVDTLPYNSLGVCLLQFKDLCFELYQPFLTFKVFSTGSNTSIWIVGVREALGMMYILKLR